MCRKLNDASVSIMDLYGKDPKGPLVLAIAALIYIWGKAAPTTTEAVNAAVRLVQEVEKR